MKIILSSRRRHYVARVGTFLITVALLAGMVGCGGSEYYTLTIASTTGGSAIHPGEGISTYDEGTVANLMAVSEEGYQFVNWTGDVSTIADTSDASTSITMNGHCSITADFAIEICNWYDLEAITDNLAGSYLLMNDLDSNTAGYTERASPTANGGKGWQSIGSIGDVFTGELIDPFTGTFDGQGYEIEDLFIDRPDEDEVGVGIFGAVDVGGVIENVEVMDADVTGFWGVGILVGGNCGSVSSSYSTGSVSGSCCVGGLTGGGSGSISDSYSIASVSGFTGVGGLVGFNGGNVSNSYADGDVTGEYNVGGLVGENYYVTVGSSHATGSVTGGNCTGGLVGLNSYGDVSNSYATGSVTGGWCVGGLVGWNDGDVSNSYATGSVDSNEWVGGLVGQNNGDVSNSYAIGSVDGNEWVGGLVGSNWGTVSNSFWDTQTSGQGTSSGGIGKNTAQIKDFDTFSGAGWSIIGVDYSYERNTNYIWNVVDDVTYPFLTIGKTGDANGDGVIDTGDITKIKRIYFGIDDPTPCADANMDGVVDTGDITKVKRIYFELDDPTPCADAKGMVR
jgi:hypothetical protein